MFGLVRPKETARLAIELIKWINNHSRALGLFRKRQAEVLGGPTKVKALIRPVLTRWTCYYLSMACLLELSDALKTWAILDSKAVVESVGKKASDRKAASDILEILSNNAFWTGLERYRARHRTIDWSTNLVSYV